MPIVSTARLRIPTETSELELPLGLDFSPPENKNSPPATAKFSSNLAAELAEFRDFGEATRQLTTVASTFAGLRVEVPAYVNEYWTARQRQASSLHEVSYRACFKPQLPR